MNPSEQKIYEYQLIKILGAVSCNVSSNFLKGSFALVYLAMNELTNELVAVKELKF
jgi:serine/threonine protein kinase